jgi:hypothetical protein
MEKVKEAQEKERGHIVRFVEDHPERMGWLRTRMRILREDAVKVRRGDQECVVACRPSGRRAPGHSSRLDVHGDGYGAVRFQLTDEGRILTRAGKWVYKRDGLYVHHLALFLKDTQGVKDAFQKNAERDDKQKCDFSHLCGNPLCMNPEHIILEPHWVNLERKRCHNGDRQVCSHQPVCILGMVDH